MDARAIGKLKTKFAEAAQAGSLEDVSSVLIELVTIVESIEKRVAKMERDWPKTVELR